MSRRKKGLRLEWMDPDQLAEHPENWKTHPESQVESLESVMGQVGWAGALLYNERTGRLLDGHARKKLDTKLLIDGKVPVLIGSWSEKDERLILATLDPLAAMAQTNEEALKAILEGLEVENKALQAMLTGLVGEVEVDEEPPDNFPSVDEDIHTDYQCPQCGFEWSGKPK